MRGCVCTLCSVFKKKKKHYSLFLNASELRSLMWVGFFIFLLQTFFHQARCLIYYFVKSSFAQMFLMTFYDYLNS